MDIFICTYMYFYMTLSVILLSTLIILPSTLSVIRHLICEQKLELAFELESDLPDTMDCGSTWLVDLQPGKTQLVSFYWSNNTGVIDLKMEGSIIEEKSCFKMLGLTFSSKLDWSSYIISIAIKSPPTKLEPWFILWSFFLLRLLFISINLPYAHAWNTVFKSGLAPLVVTWNCYVSYKTDMQDCQSFTCYLPWTLSSSSKCNHLKSFL